MSVVRGPRRNRHAWLQDLAERSASTYHECRVDLEGRHRFAIVLRLDVDESIGLTLDLAGVRLRAGELDWLRAATALLVQTYPGGAR